MNDLQNFDDKCDGTSMSLYRIVIINKQNVIGTPMSLLIVTKNVIGPPCPSALAEAVPPAFPISPRQDQQGAWGAGQAGEKIDFLVEKKS